MSTTGRIHSIESCGTVDGPGIRYVVFVQGCRLRCQYCHNPDTWKINSGKEITSENILTDIKKYKPYMNFSGGGLTITGGEPLLQPDFVKEVFALCKEEGIHTALDTSGTIDLNIAKPVLDYTDLVLLDIKNYDPVVYKNITGAELAPTLEFENYLDEINKPAWIRYVLVPGLSDNYDYIDKLAKYLSTKSNIERVEILPFHKLGEYKWEELGYKYKLKNTVEPNKDELKKAYTIFKKYDLPIQKIV